MPGTSSALSYARIRNPSRSVGPPSSSLGSNRSDGVGRQFESTELIPCMLLQHVLILKLRRSSQTKE